MILRYIRSATMSALQWDNQMFSKAQRLSHDQRVEMADIIIRK